MERFFIFMKIPLNKIQSTAKIITDLLSPAYRFLQHPAHTYATVLNVNPVVIRRLLQQLKRAGIIHVKRGSGGTDIEKPLNEITLFVINAL